MLVTRQNHIPFSWLIMVTLPWVLFYFMIQVNGLNFFILNRLIENPVTLTLVLSLPNLLFTIIPLGAYISFMSDRIWTRWGRRKIFLIVNFTGQAIVLFFYPLAPDIWVFVALMFMGSFVGTFGTPFEALKLEIIPPQMRGRSGALNVWVVTVMNIVFWGVVLGRFDEVLPILGRHVSGVTLLFWGASVALLIVVYNYFFGIHEVQPKSTMTGEKFDIKKAWRALTMPQLRYLYVFITATAMLNTGLGIFGQLLYINQWGYSLQEMGLNVAVGGIINLFVIPAVGMFADKGQNHRMKIWITCLIMVNLLTVGAYCYYTWYLPDQRPSLVEIIFFGETTCIFSILAGMVYYPLVYDYVPRNLMGTYMAGSGILGTIIGFLTSVGIGSFMWVWATLFQPPAGEMVRVCLAREMKQPQVAQIIHDAGISRPDGAKAAARDIVAKPWYANGIVCDSGMCYEFRLKDADSEKKRKLRDKLKNKNDVLEAKIKQKRKAGAAEETIAKLEKELAAKKTQHDQLDSVLNKRASAWRQEVLNGLGDNVVAEGAEVLSQQSAMAAVALVPTTHKATSAMVDKLNQLLQADDSSAIDLNAATMGRGFALSVASVLPPGKSPDDVMRPLCMRLAAIADKATPGLLAAGASPSPAVAKPAVAFDIALVENPVRTFVSLISRVVNSVLSHFTTLPPPDQKLISLGRNVCKGDAIGHARVAALAGRNGVHIMVVPGSDTVSDMESWKAAALAKIRTESTSLKLTMLTPVVDKGVVPMRYNYLAGNIYMFTMVFLGFLLVMFFIRMERAGRVKKWGAEEARLEKKLARERKEASEAAVAASAAQPAAGNGGSAQPETYTPGYLTPKILGAVAGLIVMGIGFHEAWPNLHLLLTGARTEAIAESVVAKKPGQADVVMKSQADVDAKLKAVGDAKDYTWSFYNEFSFETTEGAPVTFSRSVGSKLKPAMPLLDEYGLPTTTTVYYDKEDPSRTVVPFEYSTWLAPVLIAFLGLILFVLGTILALHARKPIVLSSADAINLT